MSTEASPRPWRVRDDRTFVAIQSSPKVGETYGEMVTISSGGFTKPRGAGAANAALIVKAVNAHEELVATLASIRDKARSLASDEMTSNRGLWKACADEADAALTKAGEL